MRRMVLALTLAGFGFLGGLAWPRHAGVIPADLTAARPAALAQPAAQGGQQAGRPAPVPRPELADEERATIGLFERASPSVVFITSLSRSATPSAWTRR